MKNNTFKRVMAGTLAVLTVASPMAANVGGFLTGSVAIVASARDTIITDKYGERDMYVSDLERGDYFENNVELNKAKNNTDPLTVVFPNSMFTVEKLAATEENDLAGQDLTFTDDGNGNMVDGAAENLGESIKISQVKTIKYFVANKAGQTVKKMVIISEKDGADLHYVVSMKVEDNTKTVADFYIRVAGAGDGVIGFETQESNANGYELDFSEAAAYINSISYTGKNGGQSVLESTNVLNTGKVTVKDRTTVTIKSAARLGGGLADYIPTYENGVFTYVFDAQENKNATFEEATTPFDDKITVSAVAVTRVGGEEEKASANLKIKRAVDTEAKAFTYKMTGDPTPVETDAVEDALCPVVGSTITLTSDKPFKIADGAIKSMKENGGYETEDVVAVYKDGAFEATFVVAGALNVECNALPEDLVYTVEGQSAFATAKDDTTKVDIIDHAEVASFSVTNKTPVYADAANRVQKLDADGKPVYTDTDAIAAGTVAYNRDDKAFVELKFNVDPNLLGDAGTTHNNYEVTLTKKGKTKSEDVVTKFIYNANSVDENLPKEGGGYVLASGFTVDGKDLNVYAYGTTPAVKVIDEKSTLAKGFTFSMKDAGEYTVEMTVWGKDNKNSAKVLNADFTITPATEITESDFTLRAFYLKDKDDYEEKRAAYTAALKDSSVPAAELATRKEAYEKCVRDYALPISKNEEGVYQVGAQAKELAKAESKTVYLYAELADGTDCEITGVKILGNIGEVATDTAFNVTDANYKVDPIAFKWTLIEQAVEDKIYFETDENTEFVNGAGNPILNPKEYEGEKFVPTSYVDIETIVKRYLKGNNDVDVSNATFKYSVSAPLGEGIVDIDALIPGLPTGDDTEDAKKKYYIYATVGDLETVTPLAIQIGNTAAEPVEAILTKLTYTYGETIKPEDFAMVKYETNTVVDGLKFKDNVNVGDTNVNTEDAANIKLIIRKWNTDGSDVGQTEAFNTTNIENGLVPGKYRVEIVTVTDDDVDLNQNGYTFKDAANSTRQRRTFDIVVEKKQLDASMVKNAICKNLANGVAKLTDDDFVNKVYDVNDDETGHVAVRIDGLTSSVNKVGAYTVRIAPVKTAATDWTAIYTGTANVTWFAQDAAVDAQEATFTFNYEVKDRQTTKVWNGQGNIDDQDFAHDNIYSENGATYIHAEAKLALPNYDAMTAKQAAALKIKSIGFVYEKAGELKDLTNNEADVAVANTKLQYGICKHTDVGTQKNSDGMIAGINSTVTSIDDYIWVRPYAITEAGEIVYGTSRRLDFTTVAEKVINPQINTLELVGKKINGVNGIYYYAYATKNTRNDVLYRTAEPKAFGVVIDRTGNYSTENEAIREAYVASLKNGTYFDERGLVNTDAKKAYFNELKNAYALDLDNKDVASTAFASSNYTADECGTLIRITDSLSRVYVRTYVDFGNGLVVYSDPTTVENANDKIATQLGLATRTKAENGKFYMGAKRDAKVAAIGALPNVNTYKGVAQVFQPITFDVNGTSDEAKQNQVTEFGLIIDKNGIVDKDSFNKNEFVLNNNFLQVHAKNPNISSTTDTSNRFHYAGETVYNDLMNTPQNNSVILYGAVTAGGVATGANTGDAAISTRAYAVYQGVTFYGDVVSSTQVQN